jgi:hypothetical protein
MQREKPSVFTGDCRALFSSVWSRPVALIERHPSRTDFFMILSEG